MSTSDPIVYAALATHMSDSQIYDEFRLLQPGEPLTDYQQAVLDEAVIRGLLSASEVRAITR